MKYAKLINGEIEFAPVNKGAICNYNLDVKLMLSDGYKNFIEIEKPTTDRFFEISYKEDANQISEIINYLESEEEYLKRKTNESLQSEINSARATLKEIDSKRIRALCEPEVKDESTGETWLDYYNAQILELRKQLQNLQERIESNDIINQNLPTLDSRC